jgi:hypothetical protein
MANPGIVTMIWVACFAVGIATEIYTIFSRDPHDTLSAHIKRRMRSKWFRAFFICSMAWFIVHIMVPGYV